LTRNMVVFPLQWIFGRGGVLRVLDGDDVTGVRNVDVVELDLASWMDTRGSNETCFLAEPLNVDSSVRCEALR
jgi:hypothetical protein